MAFLASAIRRIGSSIGEAALGARGAVVWASTIGLWAAALGTSDCAGLPALTNEKTNRPTAPQQKTRRERRGLVVSGGLLRVVMAAPSSRAVGEWEDFQSLP